LYFPHIGVVRFVGEYISPLTGAAGKLRPPVKSSRNYVFDKPKNLNSEIKAKLFAFWRVYREAGYYASKCANPYTA
jgi:hypothetical protein